MLDEGDGQAEGIWYGLCIDDIIYDCFRSIPFLFYKGLFNDGL